MSSVYCLGFRQKNWHASAKCSAEEAPPLNSIYYCRKGGEDFFRVIVCGSLYSAANIFLHGWNLDIMVHFYNCISSLQVIKERRNESSTRTLWPLMN